MARRTAAFVILHTFVSSVLNMFDQIYLPAIRAALRPGGADCVQSFFSATSCLEHLHVSLESPSSLSPAPCVYSD